MEFAVPVAAVLSIPISGGGRGARAGAAPAARGADCFKAARYAAPALFSSDIPADSPLRYEAHLSFPGPSLRGESLSDSIGTFPRKDLPERMGWRRRDVGVSATGRVQDWNAAEGNPAAHCRNLVPHFVPSGPGFRREWNHRRGGICLGETLKSVAQLIVGQPVALGGNQKRFTPRGIKKV